MEQLLAISRDLEQSQQTYLRLEAELAPYGNLPTVRVPGYSHLQRCLHDVLGMFFLVPVASGSCL